MHLPLAAFSSFTCGDDGFDARWRRSVVIVSLIALVLSLAGCDEKSASEDRVSALASSASLLPNAENTKATDSHIGGEVSASSIAGATILVFSKTAGFRHDSIPAGLSALENLAREHNFTLVATEDATQFSDENLRRFNAIIFLNTTGDVLDENQQFAMERYIQSGGGFVGIHSATDTEWQDDWFWYRNLVGAVFKNHPNEPSNVQTATVQVTDKNHASTKTLPDSFSLADEWYNFRDVYEFINVVAKVDEASYQGGEHNHDHPISWYHEYDGGRAFYTGMGHASETFSNPEFISHLLGGLKYVIARNHREGTAPSLDYREARPESNRFIKKTLVEQLDEPVKLAFFPNGDALIALRPGSLKRVEYKTGTVSDAGDLNIGYDKYMELGLVGVAVDPDFATSSWIYAAFNVAEGSGDNKQWKQRLSRFKWQGNMVDAATEQMLLEYPIDSNCCHTGGDLQFGNDGELFFSTGDNTNPHEQEGYSPVDFREGMKKNDGLRSAGNTMDLRGKILRIKPKPEGGYDIPAGNLFTDPAQGRAEIYVMGARNPYSITFDRKTGHLFYADVGPDASKPSDKKGSQGYDEINRVIAAGNFGWPLVIGKNQPYIYYDYVKKEAGEQVDIKAPRNISPNNTGAAVLPPAQPAFIAYPYGISDEFPELGTGGRTALVADVFRANDYPESLNRYPAYYNNKLFILDFMRAWVKAVSFDEQGRVRKIEPFAPQISYALPIDARFSPDGTLYVLEYGMSWFTGNPDARLSRIEYVGPGNRPPVARINADKAQAGVPATIVASGKNSEDLDGDAITYEWKLQCLNANCPEKNLGDTPDVQIAIDQPGQYQLTLNLTDTQGARATEQQRLSVGNEPPTVQLKSSQNKSFFWANTGTFEYEFVVADKEDGAIASVENDNPLVQFSHVPGASKQPEGHQNVDFAQHAKAIMDANNCLACHKLDQKIVGPAFQDVAKKYRNDPKALDYLIAKITNGGSGVWGEMNMPAFAGLSKEEVTALATYVLSLTEENAPKALPLVGKVELKAHDKKGFGKNDAPFTTSGESYAFTVSYTDKGANTISPIKTEKTFALVPARLDFASVIDPSSHGKRVKVAEFRDNDIVELSATDNWAGFAFGTYDLSQIRSVRVGAFFLREQAAWDIEIYHGDASGELLGAVKVTPEKLKEYQRMVIPLAKPMSDVAQLYIRVKPAASSSAEIRLADIEFNR